MIEQIAIFLENREGRVSDCCKVLTDAGVNMRALSIADTKDFGILRVLTDDNQKALTALQAAGFLSSLVELVAVEVPDQSGALADLLIALYEGGVNIDSFLKRGWLALEDKMWPKAEKYFDEALNLNADTGSQSSMNA